MNMFEKAYVFSLAMKGDTMNILKQATIFAKEAHGDQKRKYSGEPYIVHPVAVSKLVIDALRREKLDEKIIEQVAAAAVMHDVLEDTAITEQVMRAKFGDFITDLVLEVTDVSKPEDGNRETRKEIDRNHIAEGTYFGKTIKLADLIDNTRDIVANDRDFAKTYVKEKILLLYVLDSGNSYLYRIAKNLAYDAKIDLDI